MTRLPARPHMRHHLMLPRMVHAAASPTAIVAAGGGVAVGLVLGAGPLGVVALGVAGLLLRVAVAFVPVRGRWRRPERIDPFTVQEPWRLHVQSALAYRARVRERADTAPAGPRRDRLDEIAARVDAAANESWQIAKRGHSLTEARRAIDTARIDRQIAELERSLATQRDDERAVERATRALEAQRAQRATADRMDRVISDTRSQLKLLDARMGEVVVRAVELSAEMPAGVDTDPSLTSLSSDVDGLVIEMEALRQALEEVHGIGGARRALQHGPRDTRATGDEGSAGGLPASDPE